MGAVSESQTKLSPGKSSKTFMILALMMIAWTGILFAVKMIPKPIDNTLVLVNQVGYLPQDNNKRVLLQIDTRPAGHEDAVPFEALEIAENGNTSVFMGALHYLGELWHHHYYAGNISDLRTTGKYFIRVDTGEKTYDSYPFEVSPTIFNKALDYAYYFFYYQRSGCESKEIIANYPGHLACHLDDANYAENHDDPASWRNLTGAWFDAGDYNKYNGFTLNSVFTLGQIFEQNSAFFSDTTHKEFYPDSDHANHFEDIPDVLEEGVWGADFLVKCVNENGSMVERVGSNDFHGWYGYWGQPNLETDNDVSTPKDNRKFEGTAGYPILGASGLIKLAMLLQANGWLLDRVSVYQQAAEKILNYYVHPDQVNDEVLMFYLDLYKFSGYTNASYLAAADHVAQTMLADPYLPFPGFGHCGVDFKMYALGEWARVNGTVAARTLVSDAYEARWLHFWEPLSNSSDTTNYFHILKGNHSEFGEFYFWSNHFPGVSDWNVGQNSYYLCAAAAAFMAYNYTGELKFLDFGLRQLDWVMGLNPFAVCMFEGLGSFNPPCYHSRLQFVPGNIRGAVPGAVCNGIVRLLAEDKEITPDEPWFDMREPYLEKGSAEYSSNEPWLPHNVYMLLALSQLHYVI